MSNFYIRTAEVRSKVDDIKVCSKSISGKINEVNHLMNDLGFSCDYEIKRALRTVVSSLEYEKDYMDALAVALNECVNTYERTENKLISANDINNTFITMPNGTFQPISSSDESENGNYLLEALNQILLGSWTDDVNLLGTSVSVVLGLVPVLGMILDIRDWAGDIHNLCTDGATATEWICFGLDTLAVALDLIDAGEVVTPFKQAIKNGDAIGDVFEGLTKSIGKHTDEYIDIVKSVFKEADFTKVGSGFLENASKYINEVKNLPETFKSAEDFLDMLTKAGRTTNTLLQDGYNELMNLFGNYTADNSVAPQFQY